MTKPKKPGRGSTEGPGKLHFTELSEPKGGAPQAKDGSRRGIEAYRGSPKLTDELLETLLEELATGLPFDTACRTAGVWPSGVYARMESDEDFRELVARARAGAQKEVFNVHKDLAYQGAKTSGTEWMMETLWPSVFPRPTKTVDQAVTIKAPPDESAADVARDALALLTPAERLALVAQIAAENDTTPRAGDKE
jgi:hypothetical protein